MSKQEPNWNNVQIKLSPDQLLLHIHIHFKITAQQLLRVSYILQTAFCCSRALYMWTWVLLGTFWLALNTKEALYALWPTIFVLVLHIMGLGSQLLSTTSIIY